MKDLVEARYWDYQTHRLAKGREFIPGYNLYLEVVRLTINEMIRGGF